MSTVETAPASDIAVVREPAQWMLIGPGSVGGELQRQLGQTHVAERLNLSPVPKFVVRRSGIMAPDGITETGHAHISEIEDLPDAAFVAMGSTDDGEQAFDYISTLLKRDVTVVTAEKGALANFYPELREASDNFAHLGIKATVGGGTRMLDVVPHFLQDHQNVTQMHAVLNGTLAAVFSYIAPVGGTGKTLGGAVDKAIQLGYAEPDAKTPYDVIRGEAAGDTPKKAAILFNALGLGIDQQTGQETLVGWRDFAFELSDKDIARAIDESRIRRFLVSFYSGNYLANVLNDPTDDRIGGFDIKRGDWRIVGGFRDVTRNPLFKALGELNDAGSGIVIGLGPNESDGAYTFTGDGAGVRPTANAMIDDYLEKRQNRR